MLVFVSSSAFLSRFTKWRGRRSLLPMWTKRTPSFFDCSRCFSIILCTKSMILATSFGGLFQFSVEKPQTVKVWTPASRQFSMRVSRANAPASCPFVVGKLCARAQRPLPSRITAIWFGTIVPLGRDSFATVRDIII